MNRELKKTGKAFDETIEEWRDIEGYEGKYMVSNLGRVMSMDYLHTGVPTILKPKNSRGGYLQVSLCKNGAVSYRKIHRLVYDAFIGIEKPYRRYKDGNKIWVINHKDENAKNNSLDNLELITQAQNVVYGTALERSRRKQMNNEKKSKKVFQYTTKKELIRIWESTRECHRNGFDCRRISECCNMKGHQLDKREYMGYLWSYSKL